jgi:hypothetical protein
MAKKKNTSDPLLIDKLEQYLTNNFSLILSAIALIIVVIFSIQLINSFLNKKNRKIYNELGKLEILVNKGNFTSDDIEKFVDLANKYNAIKDYSLIMAAILWNTQGNKEKAILLLENNKTFNELSKSLLYDLTKNVKIQPFLSKGQLESLWAYRNILFDNKITDEELDSFRKKYKDSQLLSLLENWQ